MAEEHARRAATAVDNAWLYEEARKEIAERRRAQEELRASRDQLEVVLRGVADGVTAQDPTGRLVYANDVSARIAGYSSVEAMVETPTQERVEALEITDESGQPFPPDRLPGRRALRGEEGAEEVLRFRVLGTGEERWTIAKAAPVFGEGGRVRMAVSIFRDVTESRRAAEAMRGVREAERARIARDLHDGVLQDLSYSAASMGVMMLEAEGTEMEGRLQAAIDAVGRAARDLRGAVYDLRLEGEADRPFPELVESLVEEGRLMDPGCDISLEVEDGFPAEPLGEGGVELSRVLREALTNARRHSGAKSVTVTLGTEGGDLVAEVSDDGRGFGREAEVGGGTRSMRERAAAVGGGLRIESEPGEGTTVRLRGPLPRGVRK
jgi:PAS domain S-box-containing protein